MSFGCYVPCFLSVPVLYPGQLPSGCAYSPSPTTLFPEPTRKTQPRTSQSSLVHLPQGATPRTIITSLNSSTLTNMLQIVGQRTQFLENEFAAQRRLDRHRTYTASAIHGCSRSSAADFLSSGRHLSIERTKSRNNSFSSPSSTEIRSSSDILGIVMLLEPPVQCPIKLSRVHVRTLSVTDPAR
jgi:hypothetical protein